MKTDEQRASELCKKHGVPFLPEFRENIEAAILEALTERPAMDEDEAIPMILTCPLCGERHFDEGEFATKAHHTHACQSCGMVWRPAKVATVGVRFLPGYKNAEPPPREDDDADAAWIADEIENMTLGRVGPQMCRNIAREIVARLKAGEKQ